MSLHRDQLFAPLKQFFGFSSFRPLQEDIIRDALAGKDVFAVLPTGGAAKAFSGLTIDQFYRRMSIVEYPQRALHRVRPHIESFCAVEHLDAHARSVTIRFEEEKT